MHRTDGALATKLQPVATPEPADQAPPRPVNLARAVQSNLPFQPPSKIIPFESFAPRAPEPARPRAKSAKRPSRVVEGQGTLDFLPAMPAKARTLGTTVEAVIYCEAPVATTLHRAVAAALDWSMVLIAYGMFLVIYWMAGGQFALNKLNAMVFGGSLLLIAVTYGLFWTISGAETAGMYWAHLRLTTFDGFRPDGRQRLLRFLGSCLSLCTVIGLLWSLADEESLTWQDHISGTFPTPRALESQIFQRR